MVGQQRRSAVVEGLGFSTGERVQGDPRRPGGLPHINWVTMPGRHSVPSRHGIDPANRKTYNGFTCPRKAVSRMSVTRLSISCLALSLLVCLFAARQQDDKNQKSDKKTADQPETNRSEEHT